MPSVLVELGFISNENEENFLKSKAGQEKLATSLASAFNAYKMEVENIPAISSMAPVKPDITVDSELLSSTADQQNKTLQTSSFAQQKNTAQAISSSPTETIASTSSPIIYRVQITASTQPLSKNHSFFKGLKDIWEYKHKGYYKYTSGHFFNEDDAIQYRDSLRKQGFKDAFVVPFRGDQRLNP
jgi:N-acetylmuramoyl-L-alanine amidase